MKNLHKPKPEILKDRHITLLGCVFFGDPFHEAKEWSYENEIGNLWVRFIELAKKNRIFLKKLSNDTSIGFELHLEPADFTVTKQYYVMVGLEIGLAEEVPLEFFTKSLPRTDYLKFTTQMANKKEQGGYIYQKWMPQNDITQRYPFILQRYDPSRYRGLEDLSSEIDWLIPVQTKSRRRNVE